MKIAVIGAAGCVGAPAVFYLAANKLADEFLMIGGKRQNLLQQHALDISTAVSSRDIIIRTGDYSDLPGTDIVINAAGITQGLVNDRMELLPGNMELVKHISGRIRQYCPEAFIITATNPVDPLNYATFLAGGFDRKKLIGYSVNDSFRFREMLAKVYGAKVSQVDGMVIGEHGSTQVLLFSSAIIDGEKITVSEEVKAGIYAEIPNILKRFEELRSGRTAGWTCAIGLEMIVRAVVEDTGAVIPCSAILDGEYDVRGISMSVPVKLGKDGISDILEYDLAPDEQERLKITVAALKSAAKFVEGKK